uniref:RNA-directed DNA polymerase, eukaryota, reverse transcriptase zinc-binding domain protein n=1 Tax=Tanacetum cinerariifolium TaxID=118510 RepID=A0A6L2MY38_TANCI|nr:RNA-directed DNA polymerase, eukaryota, reverse transcriptase zinc-binding domain protein [Tanacetum cinerariifolium]
MKIGKEIDEARVEFTSSWGGILDRGRRVMCGKKGRKIMTSGVGSGIGLEKLEGEMKIDLGEERKLMVKDLSRLVEEKSLHVDSVGQETLWNKLVPKKANIFIWRTLKGRLSVRGELDKRGIDLDSKVGDVNVFSIDEFFSSNGNVNVLTFLSRVWQAVMVYRIFHLERKECDADARIKWRSVKDKPRFGHGSSKKSKVPVVKDKSCVDKAPYVVKDKADVVKDKLTNVVKDKADMVKALVAKEKDKADVVKDKSTNVFKDKADVVKAPVAKEKDKADVVKAPVAKEKDKSNFVKESQVFLF